MLVNSFFPTANLKPVYANSSQHTCLAFLFVPASKHQSPPGCKQTYTPRGKCSLVRPLSPCRCNTDRHKVGPSTVVAVLDGFSAIRRSHGVDREEHFCSSCEICFRRVCGEHVDINTMSGKHEIINFILQGLLRRALEMSKISAIEIGGLHIFSLFNIVKHNFIFFK